MNKYTATPMSYPRPLPPDVALSSGRRVRHYYDHRGHRKAVIEPGINAFSERECLEYNRLLGYRPKRS